MDRPSNGMHSCAKIAEYDKSREIVKERAQSGSWVFHNFLKITNIEAVKVRMFCMVALDLLIFFESVTCKKIEDSLKFFPINVYDGRKTV